MKNKRDNIPFVSRNEFVVSIALGCSNIAIYGVLAQFVSVNQAVLALSVLVLYLLEIAIMGIVRGKRLDRLPKRNIHGLLSEQGSVIIRNTTAPFAAFNDEGTLLWCNDAMLRIIM